MYLVIDIGGTKTLIALFSDSGRVIQRIKFKTDEELQKFKDDLKENLAKFQKRQIKSIVVAIPGIVQKNCSVEFGNRNWGKVDLYTPITKLFRCPIYFDNDASLGALFESQNIPGRTVFLTFSTGIGGGVVEQNQLLPESRLFEPGHMLYTYNGVKKEWEDIAAASALGKDLGVQFATDLRKRSDLKEMAKRIYLGLPDIVTSYNPDTVILGGPLGKIFHLYVKYLPDNLNVKYQRPKRPTESVIYGGYIYAKQKSQKVEI